MLSPFDPAAGGAAGGGVPAAGGGVPAAGVPAAAGGGVHAAGVPAAGVPATCV